MQKTQTGGTVDETESKNRLSGQSRSGSTGSLRSENLQQELTREQKEIAAAYWPLSRKAAAELKKKIRKQRSLSTEEEDFIDDYITDSLFDLVKRAETDCPERLSKFLSVSFIDRVAWYRSPKQVQIDAITDYHKDTVEAKPEQFDVVEYTGCPHPTVVAKLINSEEAFRCKLTMAEQRKWQRSQKQEVETYLKELYELE